MCVLLVIFLLTTPQVLAGPSHLTQNPSEQGFFFSNEISSEIDQVVEKAISEGKTPGAVVLVGRQENVVFEKAYGNRSLEPGVESMSVDTIFDLASLTKVVATTPAIMLLTQAGKVKLDDPAAKYIPAFGRRGKKKITIRQLLIHYSGLPADLRLRKHHRYPAKTILTRIYNIKPVAPPGVRFIYSDLGFVILGKIVEKVSGETLDQFVNENIFAPLGMNSTRFLPRSVNRGLIAPTERRGDGGMMRGQVHDPLASNLGGVAGDAGVFSTAGDLALFCQMLLNEGMLQGVRVFKPEIVREMVSPQSPPGKTDVRGFGWDINSIYSSIKGSYFSPQSYGHTGYTGTSIWIDPVTQGYLIILTNRVHPDGKGNVKELRTQMADIVGSALQGSSQPSTSVPANTNPPLENNSTQ
jgi:CubicO group peptidase (beta-lactamase class C family)